MLQNHLGILGKVYPIILSEKLMDVSRGTSLKDVASVIMSASISRVQEVGTITTVPPKKKKKFSSHVKLFHMADV